MTWNRCGPGRVVRYLGQKVRPGASGEKRVEDELPSWRSTQSLTVKETAVGLRSGSLASNGRNFEMILFLADVRVKVNRKTLLCKTSGGGTEICKIKNKNTAGSEASDFGGAGLAS